MTSCTITDFLTKDGLARPTWPAEAAEPLEPAGDNTKKLPQWWATWLQTESGNYKLLVSRLHAGLWPTVSVIDIFIQERADIEWRPLQCLARQGYTIRYNVDDTIDDDVARLRVFIVHKDDGWSRDAQESRARHGILKDRAARESLLRDCDEAIARRHARLTKEMWREHQRCKTGGFLALDEHSFIDRHVNPFAKHWLALSSPSIEMRQLGHAWRMPSQHIDNFAQLCRQRLGDGPVHYEHSYTGWLFCSAKSSDLTSRPQHVSTIRVEPGIDQRFTSIDLRLERIESRLSKLSGLSGPAQDLTVIRIPILAEFERASSLCRHIRAPFDLAGGLRCVRVTHHTLEVLRKANIPFDSDLSYLKEPKIRESIMDSIISEMKTRALHGPSPTSLGEPETPK